MSGGERGFQPAVGDVLTMPLPGGGYGACQVCGVFTEKTAVGPHVVVYALDWCSDTPPTLDQLTMVRPRRGGPADQLVHIGITESWAPPVGYVWLGAQPVRPGVPGSTSSFSGWEWLAGTVARYQRWEALPVAAKRAYAGARDDRQVEVDLGAGPVTVSQTVHELQCVLAGESPFANPRMARIPTPAGDVVRWAALNELPQLHEVHWYGQDRGLTAALAAHPAVSSLGWRDPPETVDLSATNLTRLRLEGSGVAEVRLPPGLLHLAVAGDAPARVVAAEEGRWMALAVASPTPVVPAGLAGVREVHLRVAGTVTVEVLADLTDLETLDVHWGKAPGALQQPATLARFTGLHTIKLYGAYGLDAEDLPRAVDMPALRRFEVDGLRTSQASELRSRFRNTQVQLTVRGAKNDSWLAANLNNPFRDWVEGDPRAGAAAVKAYATALRAIDGGRGRADEPTDATRTALHAMVAALNQVEAKYQVIDTIRREEAFDACLALARRAGVPAATAERWFDEWRDF